MVGNRLLSETIAESREAQSSDDKERVEPAPNRRLSRWSAFDLTDCKSVHIPEVFSL
jgi:hypothetical protein